MASPWWMRARIYELYVDTFAGTFHGLTEKLEYFEYLGINTLHILPHYPSPMVDDGYDVSDYRAVRPNLGTLDDFRACTEAAHARGIRILIDFVLNHVSEKHPWFQEARLSKTNSKRDFFKWSETGMELPDAPNAFKDFKPSNWIWNEPTQDYYYATFYPQQPDLNWRNSVLLPVMLDILDFWVAAGVDGFRLDAAPFLVEKEGTSSIGLQETHVIMAALRRHIDAKYNSQIALLAEVSARASESISYFGKSDECQLVYNFQLAPELFIALMRNERSRLDAFVRESFGALPPGSQWATFLRNHDDLALGTLDEKEREELKRFLDPGGRYSFNDGAGLSLRLGTIFAQEPRRIAEAHELLYSLPGAPILYYGDEIGMSNLLGRKFIDTRRYVRGRFDWKIAESMRADSDSILNRIARSIKNHT